MEADRLDPGVYIKSLLPLHSPARFNISHNTYWWLNSSYFTLIHSALLSQTCFCIASPISWLIRRVTGRDHGGPMLPAVTATAAQPKRTPRLVIQTLSRTLECISHRSRIRQVVRHLDLQAAATVILDQREAILRLHRHLQSRPSIAR